MQPKRPLCHGCAMPLATCYCDLVAPSKTLTQVILLQHIKEAHHAKNTGHFLHKNLTNSRIFCGETFAVESEIAYLLTQPKTQHLLLYPPTPEAKSLGIPASSQITLAEIQTSLQKTEQKLSLWILDATWKKSRKMLYLNPWLQAMPRFSLEDTPDSTYRIRKAENQYQLSSFEACCYALSQWEPEFDVSAQINAFTQFIARIGHHRPSYD